jgi:hypothetical protein
MDSFHRSFQRWIELESNYNDLFRSVVCGGAAGIVVSTLLPPQPFSSPLLTSSISLFPTTGQDGDSTGGAGKNELSDDV